MLTREELSGLVKNLIAEYARFELLGHKDLADEVLKDIIEAVSLKAIEDFKKSVTEY